MKRVARYHSSMRRRFATILSVMSLLLALATIAPQATIAPHDIKSVSITFFDHWWAFAYQRGYAWVRVNHPATGAPNFPVGPKFQFIKHEAVFFDTILIKEPPLYSFTVGAPLWAIVGAILVFPAVVGARRYTHRIEVGHCPECRYDLTGNTSGVCPECGSRISS